MSVTTPKATHETAHAAQRLLQSWGIGENGLGLAEGHLSYLEHCIHEMAHAYSLGLPFDHGVSNRITEALEDQDREIEEEARAWAIEWHVWQALKMPLDWDTLTETAELQGVEEDQVEGLLTDPQILKLSRQVIRTLHEIRQKDVQMEQPKRRGPKYTGRSALPKAIVKRECPTCGAVKGAPCFDPTVGVPWMTDVHAERKDSKQ